MKCPRCGVEMRKHRTSSGIAYQCENLDCPVFGIRGRAKRGKGGRMLYSSGDVVYESTYIGG